jgi:CheY-like chemotaxis protein
MSGEGPKKTILLVEDEVIVAMGERFELEKKGYMVIVANSGEEAIKTVEKENAIDLILMDIDLGKGLDGSEAAREILKVKDIPIVFLSSHTEPEVVEKTERISSYGYVVKDLSPGTVLDASIKMALRLFDAKKRIQYLNRIYALLSGVNQTITHIYEFPDIFQPFCDLAVEKGKFKMAWIGQVSSTTNKVNVIASRGASENYLEAIDIDLNDETRSGGPTGRSIKLLKHEICNNILEDPIMEPWREGARKNGYMSSASFPLIVRTAVWGAFSLYSPETSFFNEEEISLLDGLANDLSFAIEMHERKKVGVQVLRARGL